MLDVQMNFLPIISPNAQYFPYLAKIKVVDVKQVNEYNFSEHSQVLLIAIERNSTQKTLQKIGEKTQVIAIIECMWASMEVRIHVGLHDRMDQNLAFV